MRAPSDLEPRIAATFARIKGFIDGLALTAVFAALCVVVLLDCALRSWRGETAYPYGGVDDNP